MKSMKIFQIFNRIKFNLQNIAEMAEFFKREDKEFQIVLQPLDTKSDEEEILPVCFNLYPREKEEQN